VGRANPLAGGEPLRLASKKYRRIGLASDGLGPYKSSEKGSLSI
jgi:hypothetical protein